MSKSDTLEVLLGTLRQAIPQIRGALIASTDGLPIAHSLPHGTDPTEYAALAATLTDHGRRLGEGANSGDLNEVAIQGAVGRAFLFSTPAQAAVLAVFTELDCNTGLLRFEARKIARIVASVL
jgi:predicted regulator of Ras-like GTPase activity (Roadblock/LC7/MglB family)